MGGYPSCLPPPETLSDFHVPFSSGILCSCHTFVVSLPLFRLPGHVFRTQSRIIPISTKKTAPEAPFWFRHGKQPLCCPFRDIFYKIKDVPGAFTARISHHSSVSHTPLFRLDTHIRMLKLYSHDRHNISINLESMVLKCNPLICPPFRIHFFAFFPRQSWALVQEAMALSGTSRVFFNCDSSLCQFCLKILFVVKGVEP